MKLKKIRIPEFINTDDFGSFKAHDVEILYSPEENEITSDIFDQKTHIYYLSADEIERLSREAAQKFYDENGSAILRGDRKFKKKEINAVKSLFKISGAELGDLIGLEKSSISRILSGKQNLQIDKAMLLLERLRDELEHPGKNKITLSQIRDGVSSSRNIKSVCLPALTVADFFIREFFDSQRPITHLKLQKLLYYAQGIGFGRKNVKLIREPFLAWEHGPVIREVYNHYKAYRDEPLPRNESLDLSLIHADEVVKTLLDETISLYGVYDAWYLREKTHNEAPWVDAKRDAVITDEAMIRFFKKILV